MTISTKPEDIDSPETILHYMDSYPASGQNRAAAKLIRELLAAVPLVAARDDKLVEMTQQEFDDFEDWWLTTPVHEETIIDMKHVRMAWLAGRSALAGQIAPQATVEPLTDAQILQQWAISDKTSLSKLDTILHFARALLAATPPTSKATVDDSKFWPVDMNMSRKQMAEQIGQMNFRLTALRNENEGLNRVNARLKATSKAGTGEATRNAALEEAAAMCSKYASLWNGEYGRTASYFGDQIRTLKSATPSTIKAEPTGEQS